jgi:hypothetical protein
LRRSIVTPQLPAAAAVFPQLTAAGLGLGEGDGLGLGLGLGDADGLGNADGLGDGDGLGEALGEGLGDGLAVGLGLAAGLGDGEGDAAPTWTATLASIVLSPEVAWSVNVVFASTFTVREPRVVTVPRELIWTVCAP